jgi:hypothetical protein
MESGGEWVPRNLELRRETRENGFLAKVGANACICGDGLGGFAGLDAVACVMAGLQLLLLPLMRLPLKAGCHAGVQCLGDWMIWALCGTLVHPS